jgi:hypothetical protein
MISSDGILFETSGQQFSFALIRRWSDPSVAHWIEQNDKGVEMPICGLQKKCPHKPPEGALKCPACLALLARN